MRTLTLMIGLLVAANVAAQRMESAFGAFQPDGNAVALEAHLGMASRQLTNRFIGGLLFSDVLPSAVVADQMDKLASNNRIGGDVKLGALGKWHPEGSPFSWWINASDQLHLGANLPADAMRLAFQGNGPFKGRTLVLDNAEVNYLRFQKAGLGAEWKMNLGTTVGLMVSFVNGEQWMNVAGETGSLYTSMRGDTLRTDWTGRFSTSDTSNTGLGAHNGGGLAIDAFWSHRMTTNDGYVDFGLLVQDLGRVQWHPTAVHLDVDTTIDFTGVELGVSDGVFGFDGDGLVGQSEETLTSFTRTRTQDIWLPGWIQLQMHKHVVDRGLEWSGGLVWRPFTLAKVYQWAGSSYRFSKSFSAGGEVGYGGFGGLQVMVLAEYSGDYFGARARIGNLESLLLPGFQSGALISLGVHYRWQ